MTRRAIRPVGVSRRFCAGRAAGVLGLPGHEADEVEVSAFLGHVGRGLDVVVAGGAAGLGGGNVPVVARIGGWERGTCRDNSR